MSITFHVYEANETTERHATVWDLHRKFCAQCSSSAYWCDSGWKIYEAVSAVENQGTLNVSNSNAFAIFELVGAEFDYCGSIDGESLADFREKVSFALASLIEMPALDGGSETFADGNVIHCGRRDGYFVDVLSALLSIADNAIERNAKFAWS